GDGRRERGVPDCDGGLVGSVPVGLQARELVDNLAYARIGFDAKRAYGWRRRLLRPDLSGIYGRVPPVERLRRARSDDEVAWRGWLAGLGGQPACVYRHCEPGRWPARNGLPGV